MRLRPTDQLFRKYVLLRDDYTCAKCKKKYSPDENLQGLHVSHYWGRGRENTRFAPDNVCLLCYGCHRIWGHGDGKDQYKQFMIDRLTQQGFDMLDVRAHLSKKRDDSLDKIFIKELLKEVT